MRIRSMAVVALLAMFTAACSDESSSTSTSSAGAEDVSDTALDGDGGSTQTLDPADEGGDDDEDLGLPFGIATVLLDGQVLTFDVLCSVSPLVNSAGPEKTSGNALLAWYLEPGTDGYRLVVGDAGTGENWSFTGLDVVESAQGYEISATSTSSLTGVSAPFEASVVCK